jgi:site-specific DNA-methyltransferase (adenine-specific)
MKLYSENDSYKIYNGDMLDMLQVIEPESIDAIVCDPPYELGFMNKIWDSTGIAFKKETWQNCFEVLKPGGYLLAFGGSRTYHRIACAIEDAGFEIRDCVMYLYGTGFSKSYNIGLAIDKKNGVESEVVGIATSGCNSRAYQSEKATTAGNYEIKKAQNEWQGWGTCLKPAYEPVIVARKPFKGSVVDNIIKYRVGGLNIDECRVKFENTQNPATNPLFRKQGGYKLPEKGQLSNGAIPFSSSKNDVNELGRFPANVITDGSEEVAKGMPNTTSQYNPEGKHQNEINRENEDILKYGYKQRIETGFNDSGSAMRYFYSAKASKKDRDEGLDNLNDGLLRRVRPDKNDDKPTGLNKDPRFAPVVRKNIHPTCKPTELMQYLVRLVSPKGATILDPFMGSGSTGKAVMFENRERDANYKFIGIELTDEYLPIAQARIEYARDKFKYDLEQEKVTKGKQNIFDFMESEE